MADTGNSNRISRDYLDSLLIETRYMDAQVPDISYELYGAKVSSPIMTAALSHLDHFMFPGAADALAKGAKEAGAILWYGMGPECWPSASISTIPSARMVRRISSAAS